MTSYFIKFMLLLMVTLSISQANATVVYYKNTNNWETPKAHMWNGGEATSWPGKEMYNLGDGWYSIDAGNNKSIIFNRGSNANQTAILQMHENGSLDVTFYVTLMSLLWEPHIGLKIKISHWRTPQKRAMNVRSLTISPTNPSLSQKENRCHTKQSTSLVA